MRRELTLEVMPERVWDALASSDRLSSWFGAEVEIELQPGGKLAFEWPDGSVRRGLVEVVEPPHRLAFRWRRMERTPSGLRVGRATRVELVLDRVPAGTRLSVTEEEALSAVRGVGEIEAGSDPEGSPDGGPDARELLARA
jgi:uncharacterized protein YndB with AHSA1/START domain